MEEKKLTKRELYVMTRGVIENSGVADADELIEFIDKQIVMIDNKAEKAKERAAEKRAAGDELRATIKSVLTNEYQTADAIVAAINDEDVTKAKVIARLGQLVKNGEAEKTDSKVDGRSIKVYRLAE